MGLKNQGAGMPDGGLFVESQFKKRSDVAPVPGQVPERGVIEVKPVGTDVDGLVIGEQVARYWAKYRLMKPFGSSPLAVIRSSRNGCRTASVRCSEVT